MTISEFIYEILNNYDFNGQREFFIDTGKKRIEVDHLMIEFSNGRTVINIEDEVSNENN